MDPKTDPEFYKFMMAKRAFVRVYRLPKDLIQGYCFGGGVLIPFTNVDWFEHPIDGKVGDLIEFIKKKRYYHPEHRFLVLGDHPSFVFTIEKEQANDTKGSVRSEKS